MIESTAKPDSDSERLGLSAYQSPRGLAKGLQVVFVGWTGMAALVVAANWMQYRLVARLLDNPLAVTLEQAQASDDRRATLGRISALAGLATAVVFITWTRRLYRNLPALGAQNLRFKPGWAVGGWFVPILNLWRPKQIIDDCWRASDLTLPDPVGGEWRGRPVAALVHWWWVVYLGGAVGGGLIGAVIGTDIDSRGEAGLILAGSVISLAAAILAFWVVTRLTDRQEVRARAIGVTASEAGEASVQAVTSTDEAVVGKRQWWQYAALPVVAVAVVAIGAVVWDEPSAGVKVESDASSAAASEVVIYSNHGITFEYPGNLTAQELGIFGEGADDTSGMVAAMNRDDTQSLAVAWAPTFGSEVTAADLIAGVDLDQLGSTVQRSEVVETERHDQLVVYRTWVGDIGLESAFGVSGACTCESGSRVATVIVIRNASVGSPAEVLTDYLSLIDSLHC